MARTGCQARGSIRRWRTASGIGVAPLPDITGTGVVHLDGGGTHTEGDTFRYRFAFVDAVGTESPVSAEILATIPAGDTLWPPAP